MNEPQITVGKLIEELEKMPKDFIVFGRVRYQNTGVNYLTDMPIQEGSVSRMHPQRKRRNVTIFI